LHSPLPSTGRHTARAFRISQFATGNRAFTLVELLVVISIIVILGAIAFPVAQGALERAKKTQAKNDLVQLVTAVNAFYTEYGKYPLPGAATKAPDDYWIVDSSIGDLCNVLRATGFSWDASPHNLNPRRIVFLNIPYAKDASKPKNGIAPSGPNAGKYYDPWGYTYRLRIDWDYDNQLVNPYTQGAGGSPVSAGVIGYSIGRDGTSGADSNTGRRSVGGTKNPDDDDVLSWQ
jgi:prepilin-type N-terminal cleavage/methylation domain-containing protein